MERDRYFDRYGVSTWLYQNQSLEEALTKVAAAGFRIVEVWAWNAHLDPRLHPNLTEVKSLVKRLGLNVHSLHSPSGPELRIGDPDPALRKEWEAAIEPCLDYAAELGALGVVVHVSSLREPLDPKVYEEGCRAVTEFIYHLQERASELGVNLLLENMIDHGFPRLGRSLQELSRLFPEPGFGFCLDTGHALLNKVSIPDEVSATGQRLLSVHASNNDGQTDWHQLPINGALSWPEVCAALNSIGYDHPLILEINGGEDPDAVLKNLADMWQYL